MASLDQKLHEKLADYYRDTYGYEGSVTIPVRLLDDLDERTGGGTAFSADNPYYQQMFLAQNKDDLIRLQTAAIEWEANLGQYERQLADQERLRDEERAYQDPRAQISRQRAAGLNPDIAGGSGASSAAAGGSHTQAPAMADTQVEGLRDNQELLQTVFSGISTVGGALVNLTSVMNGLADFSFAVESFSDRASLIGSEASIKADEALVSKATTASLINSIGDSAALQRMGLVKQLSTHFTDLTDVESVKADMQALGISDVDAVFGMMQRHQSSPQVRGYIDSMVSAADEARAKRENMSFDFYSRFYGMQSATTLMRASVDRATAEFNNQLSALTLTPEVASQEASIFHRDLQTRDTVSQEDEARARRNFEAFSESIKSIDSAIRDVDAELESWSSSNTPHARMYKKALQIYRTSLRTMRTEQFSSVITTLQGLANVEFDVEQNSNPKGDYNVFSKWLQISSKSLRETLFTPSGDTDSSSALSYIGDLFELILTKKIPGARAAKASAAAVD